MLEGLITQLANDAFTVLVPAVAAMTVEYLRRKLGTEKMQKIQEELNAKQELGIVAVRFAEQAYKDFDGSVKYDQAAAWLATRSRQHGISISEDEIKVLIESGLRCLKDSYGNAWTKAVQVDSK